MRKIFILFLVFIVPLVFSGCDLNFQESGGKLANQAIDKLSGQLTNMADYPNWYQITDGMQLKEYITEDGLETITVIKLEPDNFRFEILQDENNPKSVADWRAEKNALLVVNAAYFNENNLPTGYLRTSDGQEYGQVYYRGENGYTGAFVIGYEGEVDVRYLLHTNYGLTELKTIQATFQTFPTLIIPGSKAALLDETVNQAKRTILAQDDDLNLYIILTQSDYFSLTEVRDYLLNSDLDLDIAINLDGGTSSGVSIKADNFSYGLSSFYVPSVIAIYEK